MGRTRFGRRALSAGGIALLIALPHAAWAGTTGKLTGRVIDPKKQPLVGVNVTVPLARLGANTDADGRFTILNLPSGAYEVKAALLGYGPVAVRNVLISADNTTPLEITLTEAPVLMKEVVVNARRPVVDLKSTSNLAAVSREEIKDLPVQELQEVVNLQAGVVEGHFRGGRLGEVQYQVDGVSVNNAYDNTTTLRIDRSLIEEVQVISGTFDAEYGQAMSGVVNAVLRRGTDQLRWNAEAFSGGPLFSGRGRTDQDARGSTFALNHGFRPAGTQNYQASVSGPLGRSKTYFLLSGRRYANDDYLRGIRRFRPTDGSDFANNIFRPSGDGASVPLGFTREWSGVVKLSNRSLSNIDISYQAIFNDLRGRRSDFAFRFDPDGLSRQHTVSIVHGIDWSQTLSKTTFYNLSLRQNYFNYKDALYESIFDPRYAAGPPLGDPDYELGAIVQGVEFTRFRQKTDAKVFKGSLTSQWTRDQQLKVGAEYQWPKVGFGSGLYLTKAGDQLVLREADPPHFSPYIAAAFAQNDLEWNDLRIKGGLRLEYFNPRAILPSDLSNPANSISGVPLSHARVATRKLSLAPRVGVSYPVTNRAALFFAYGHFYQMPSIGDMFKNSDYSVLANLQAGGIDFGVLGNPDLRPERTVQYQFGYKQALNDWLGVDVSTFYKDIRDLLGVEFISTYNDAEYARLTNVDFGNVIGFTVSVDQRQRGLFSTSLDYTWEMAQGNSSDPRETATRASAGEDPRPREIPFNWDQRHTFNATVKVSRDKSYSISTIIRVASGQPYTPALTSGFAGGLEANSGRKPAGTLVDLRGEKILHFAGLELSAFARVFNVFDSRFFNGFVFANSGSPYYSRFTGTDLPRLIDPTRLYGPRRLEIGITTGGAQQ